MASKTDTKNIVWDYVSLEVGSEGKTIDDGSAICGVVESECWKSIGTPRALTNKPFRARLTSEGSQGSKESKQLDHKATPAPPTSSQQMLQESVVMWVWKELTGTVIYFIAKDSLPTYEKNASSGC